jgi:hypothetical protein
VKERGSPKGGWIWGYVCSLTDGGSDQSTLKATARSAWLPGKIALSIVISRLRILACSAIAMINLGQCQDCTFLVPNAVKSTIFHRLSNTVMIVFVFVE